MLVGFIGLGAMGRAMAANLIRAGHRVRVWNRSPGPAQELVGLGGEAVDTPREAGETEILISMLANDAVVRDVLIEGHVIEAMSASAVHVNMATISPPLAIELAALHQAHGTAYVAAPVFGRPNAAAAGQLNIIAAGDGAAIDRVQPLLDVMGQKTWRLGAEPQEANVVKIAGNFMIGSAIETMAEASTLAQGYGVSAGQFLDIMTNTLFSSPAYKSYAPLIAEQRYEPAAFKLSLGLKDIRLALEAADAVAAPMPFASVLRDNLLDAVSHGDGESDWAALAKVAARRAGLA